MNKRRKIASIVQMLYTMIYCPFLPGLEAIRQLPSHPVKDYDGRMQILINNNIQISTTKNNSRTQKAR
jgi:hypothetical protein